VHHRHMTSPGTVHIYIYSKHALLRRRSSGHVRVECAASHHPQPSPGVSTRAARRAQHRNLFGRHFQRPCLNSSTTKTRSPSHGYKGWRQQAERRRETQDLYIRINRTLVNLLAGWSANTLNFCTAICPRFTLTILKPGRVVVDLSSRWEFDAAASDLHCHVSDGRQRAHVLLTLWPHHRT
jgi:hypothetical protein